MCGGVLPCAWCVMVCDLWWQCLVVAVQGGAVQGGV